MAAGPRRSRPKCVVEAVRMDARLRSPHTRDCAWRRRWPAQISPRPIPKPAACVRARYCATRARGDCSVRARLSRPGAPVPALPALACMLDRGPRRMDPPWIDATSTHRQNTAAPRRQRLHRGFDPGACNLAAFDVPAPTSRQRGSSLRWNPESRRRAQLRHIAIPLDDRHTTTPVHCDSVYWPAR